MPTPSIETPLSEADGRWLLSRARAVIAERLGLEAIASDTSPSDALRRDGACFVTLTRKGQLRGCIGTLNATEPLADAVAHYAQCAAFDDPRFPLLTADEWPQLSVEVSVLSSPQPVAAASEQQLLAKLEPGVHGLTIEHDHHRATFLPQVWDNLSEPHEFLRQLKRKAGLVDDFPVASLNCSIYTVIHFAD